nr:serine/threonine protein kinase [Myxococcota bacterium]
MGGPKPSGTEETISTGGTGLSGSTTSQGLAPGTMVGEYQIDKQLGEGGMGRVFSAIHPVIAKRAAIKVLHPEFSANAEMVQRFIQEARSVNQIGHPNIVDIFAFGALPDGRFYFVMECLRGQSLRDCITKRRLAPMEALAILETVTSTLEAAHEKGIVHRDLKPDNVFLVEVKGNLPQVKLLDFGIAKLLGDDGRVQRTRTGNLMGTPGYMSPEQARGQDVDHRTDVYALGAVAYELLTGWLPFPADNAADMIAKHLFAPVPSARLKNPGVPAELDQLVMAMMAKDVAHRPSLAVVGDHIRALRAHGAFAAMHAANADRSGVQPTGPVGAAGMLTPSPQITPAPAMTTPYAGQTAPPTRGPAPTMTSAAPRRSRAPLFVMLAVLVVGGIVAVAVVVNNKSASATETTAAPT